MALGQPTGVASREHGPGTDRQICLWWTAVALVLYLLLGLVAIAGQGGPSWFVHFGRNSSAIGLARKELGPHVIVPHVDGHDGQAYWVLARDPLLVHPGQDRAALDRPAYRAQRIAYPLLAWPWKLLGEQGLVWGMVITNLTVVVIGAWLATALALDVGAEARASLAWTLNPAVLTSFILDTSDALALAALLAALLCIRRRRFSWAMAAAVLGVLAKEPTLLAFIGIVFLAPHQLPRRARTGLVAVSALAGLVWAFYARLRFHWPSSQIQEFSAPFWGYIDAYRRGWSPVGNWADAVVAVAVLAFGAAVVRVWWERRGLLLTAALPFALLVPFFSAQVLDLADNSLRAIGPAVTLLGLELYRPRSEQSRRAGVGAIPTAG